MSLEIDHLWLLINNAASTEEAGDKQQQIEPFINDLINHNFKGLLQLLYRIDISEEKLKALLQQHQDKDAAAIIAQLILERQQEKLNTKKSFRQQTTDPDEEEKW